MLPNLTLAPSLFYFFRAPPGGRAGGGRRDRSLSHERSDRHLATETETHVREEACLYLRSAIDRSIDPSRLAALLFLPHPVVEVHRKEEEAVRLREGAADLLGPVPVVDVDVHDGHPLEVVMAQGVHGAHGHVVEDAKAAAHLGGRGAQKKHTHTRT